MTKYFFLALFGFLMVAASSNAGSSFATIKDANDERRQMEQDAIQRDAQKLQVLSDILVELKKSNALNLEILQKLSVEEQPR